MFRFPLRIRPKLLLFLLAFAWLTVSCRSPQLGDEIIITITANGATSEVSVTAGSTVSQAMQTAGLATGKLDRTEPPLYTVLSEGRSEERRVGKECRSRGEPYH